MSFKIPLTEYFIGFHLAALASGNDDNQRAFVAAFRRWAWQPDMHECLYFAFEMMSAGTSQQQSLASECVEWLINIATHCPLNPSAKVKPDDDPCHAQDDLLCSFAILASKLTSQSVDIIPALLSIRERRVRHHPGSNIPVLARIPLELVDSYLRHIIKSWAGSTPNEKDVRSAILKHGLERMPPWQLKLFVDEVLIPDQGRDVAKIDFPAVIPWAVWRIPPGQLKSSISDWLSILKGSTGSKANALTLAIGYGAEGILESEAGACVRELLHELKSYSGTVAEDLADAIRHAADRVSESAAEECIRELLAALEDKDERTASVLVDAIGFAASRLPESDAALCMERWLSELEGKKERITAALEQAIVCAARRLPESEAASRIHHWIFSAIGEGRQRMEVLAYAIGRAAERLPRDRAASCMQDLLTAIQQERNEVADGIAWSMSRVAFRLPAAAVEDVIGDLLAMLPGKTERITENLVFAIACAAGGILPEGAERCIRLVLAELENKPAPVIDRLEEAMCSAAGQIPKEAAERCIKDWLAELKDKCDVAKHAIAWIVESAARRIPEDAAERCLHDLLTALIGASDSIAKALTTAIDSVVKSMPERTRIHYIPRWLAEFADMDGSRSEVWARLIRAATDSISPESAFRLSQIFHPSKGSRDSKLSTLLHEQLWKVVPKMSVEAAIELARRMMSEGDGQSAIRAASFQPLLAARVSEIDPRTQVAKYEFFWRGDHKLRLDDEVARYASVGIRTLLGQSGNRHDHSQSRHGEVQSVVIVPKDKVKSPDSEVAGRVTDRSGTMEAGSTGNEIQEAWDNIPDQDRITCQIVVEVVHTHQFFDTEKELVKAVIADPRSKTTNQRARTTISRIMLKHLRLFVATPLGGGYKLTKEGELLIQMWEKPPFYDAQ